MSKVVLPKPDFTSSDETSLTFKYNVASLQLGDDVLILQYKTPEQTWAESQYIECAVAKGAQEIKLETISLPDLQPGTPYFVRFAVKAANGPSLINIGPETVFDTSPVDCTPKQQKKCTIS